MATPSLYDEGWKQGSLIKASLEAHFLDLDGGTVTKKSIVYDHWLLATQDCDLAQTSSRNATRLFELRPVLLQSNDDKLDGLRSRSVSVRDGLVLRAESPKVTITARALNTLKSAREAELGADRRAEIKAWLGLRYDRPAIPTRFVDLAGKLRTRYISRQPAQFNGVLRDVWVYFEDEAHVRLFFILADGMDARRDDVLDWIDDVAGELADSAGIVVAERQAETGRRTPLWVLQNYFGLDLADLSSRDPRA